MTARRHTGGLKEFIYEGDEKLEDTDSTRAFKEAYHKWINSKTYKIKKFLTGRSHRRYHRWDRFFINILWLVLLLIIFLIIYSNLEKLNEIIILFIRLGNTLLLVCAFFWIKYFWKLLKRISYWFKGERNWAKYLTIFILIFLAWRVYSQKDIFNPVIEFIETKDLLDFSPFKPGFFADIGEFFELSPEIKEECRIAFDYVNRLRLDNDRKAIKWDDRLYQLAVARSKDMYERNYFDHVTLEGKCVKDFKADYGLAKYTIAENNGAQYSGYSDYDMSFDTSIDPKEQVDNWMSSRGHRYNLMYPSHILGAIGCYYGVCVFLGAHQDAYGLGAGPCTTGDEVLAYWETVGKQLGEI